MLAAITSPQGNPYHTANKRRGDAIESYAILAAARKTAQIAGLRYAGNVTRRDARHLSTSRAALLIDVRTAEERQFVGYVSQSLHVAWLNDDMMKNPRFLHELAARASKDDVLLFLCRSGKRSAAAAEAAAKAGFRNVFSVAEGFDDSHPGMYGGWRSNSLLPRL